MFPGLAVKLAQRASDGQELIFEPSIACSVVFEASIDPPDQRSGGKIVVVQSLKELDGGFGVRRSRPRNASRGFRVVTCFGNGVVEQPSGAKL